MVSTTPLRKPLTVFYSYAHEDERFRHQLATHLALLKRQSIIAEWHDRLIGAGQAWRPAIDEHLEAADIILLLVSPDFIASDFCWGEEMEHALAKHKRGEARVIPVIVRPVDWTTAPFARLQILPKDAKAVILWTTRDLAWLDVAKGIRQAAEEMAAGLPAEQTAVGPSIVQPITAPSSMRSAPRLLPRPGGQLQRRIYNAKNKTTLSGQLARSEGEPATGDIIVDEVYDGLESVYNFFWDVYERNSIDNQGMQLKATVHYGKEYTQAFWIGT